MADQLSAEDFTEFIDSLRSIVERTASVYRASDHVGLEICARKLEENTRMLIAISQSQNSSLGDLFEVLRSVFSYVIEKDVRYFKCIQRSSKGEPSIGILRKHRRKTGVHYYKGNDRATS